MNCENLTQNVPTVRVQIDQVQNDQNKRSSPSATIFEPQSSIETMESSNRNSVSPIDFEPPEKKITLFALRLAVLEKAATNLGALGFIWATVVLLGGFAITLDTSDFWLITIILVIEGTRIFSRSRELEWQCRVTWSIADVGINSFRALKSSSHFFVKIIKGVLQPLNVVKTKQSQRRREIAANSNASGQGERADLRQSTRTWATSEVPLLPYAPWVFLSRNISKLLYWLQLLSATACVGLSLFKLITHNYGEVQKGDMDKRNRKLALTIFYALALAEALLFLMEKACWEWEIMFCKLFETVNKECDLGSSGLVSIRRFFYDAYAKCINGSIFDGLKMDMVSFAMNLLASNSPDEQIIGARILRRFAANNKFSDDTLQKIGVNLPVIERLVEILNWKDPREEEIRLASAEILSELAGKKQNSLRVAGIFGAMESISSLLHTSKCSNAAFDEIHDKKIISDHENYDFWTFNHLGLRILKKLARDHDNCGKIGNTRGLLPKVIDFTHAGDTLLNNTNAAESQIRSVKRSLQVVKMLASTTGTTGKHLRREISEIIFTISNIRNILRHGSRHPELQKLGIEILTNLAVDVDATERIGSTGGILKDLFIIFFNEDTPADQDHVRIAAGEALAMLALESKSNCNRILNLEVIEKLVGAIKVPLLCINAARILRNLCSYTGAESFNRLKGITEATPTVLKAIMSEQHLKLQEVMIGLAAEAFKFMDSQESNTMLARSGIRDNELAKRLVQILQNHQYPPTKTPRIRRFSIELAIWMIEDNKTNVKVFKDLGMERELKGVMETTAEVENFNIFSGTIGVSRYSTSIQSLVEAALKLLAE